MSQKKKTNKKKSNWIPPSDYKSYFYATSDAEFKAKLISWLLCSYLSFNDFNNLI